MVAHSVRSAYRLAAASMTLSVSWRQGPLQSSKNVANVSSSQHRHCCALLVGQYLKMREPGGPLINTRRLTPRPMRFLFALVAIVSLTNSSQAQEFTSPSDLLSALYNQYLGGYAVSNFEPYFSDSLTQATHGAQVPRAALKKLGLDPITGLSEPHLMTTFNLETVDTSGPRATSIATFNADGKAYTITFELVHEELHGWQIDHISGKAGDITWCTNDLIAAVAGADQN